MLDILEFWQPAIDWERFKQGPVSDAVWDQFKQVVIWCHAFRHWTEDARAKRSSPPICTIFPEESARLLRSAGRNGSGTSSKARYAGTGRNI
jgi:hypothetical protein